MNNEKIPQNNGKCKINKGDKLTINVPFFQVPNSIFDDEHDLKVWEIAVYCYLARCGNQGSVAFPSLETIGRRCGMSRRKAADAINILIDKGYLKRKTIAGVGCEYKILYNSEPVQDMHGTSAGHARVTSAGHAHNKELFLYKERERENQPEKPPAPSIDLLKEKPKNAVSEAVTLICNLYNERFNANYPVTKGTDHGIIKQLINEYGLDTVKEIIKLHVKTNDGWILERGCAITTIKNSLPGYLKTIRQRQEEAERERRQHEADRQRQEEERKKEEAAARKRAEYEALPEVEKARIDLEEYRERLKAMKPIRERAAAKGDQVAINKIKEYEQKEAELLRRYEQLKQPGEPVKV